MNDNRDRPTTDLNEDLDPLKEQWDLLTVKMDGERKNEANLYTGSYKLQDKNDELSGQKRTFQSVFIKPDKENTRIGKIPNSQKGKLAEDKQNTDSKKDELDEVKENPEKDKDSKQVKPKNVKDNDSKINKLDEEKDVAKNESNSNSKDKFDEDKTNINNTVISELDTDKDKISNSKKDQLQDATDNESNKDKPDESEANKEKDNNSNQEELAKDKDKNKVSELETAIIEPNKEEKSNSDNGKATSEEEKNQVDLQTLPGKLNNESKEIQKEEESTNAAKLKTDQTKDKYLHEIDEMILKSSPDELKDERIRLIEKKDNPELSKITQRLSEIKNSTTDEKTVFDKISDFFQNMFSPVSDAEVSEENAEKDENSDPNIVT